MIVSDFLQSISNQIKAHLALKVIFLAIFWIITPIYERAPNNIVNVDISMSIDALIRYLLKPLLVFIQMLFFIENF